MEKAIEGSISTSKIKNRKQLAESSDDYLRKGRELVLQLLEEVIEISNPVQAIKDKIRYDSVKQSIFIDNTIEIHLNNKKVIVVGGGKASGQMALAIEEIFENVLEEGVVLIPRGFKPEKNLLKIKLLENDHPIPSYDNIKNTKEMITLLHNNSEDFIITLISGGGSSILTFPNHPISIIDLQMTNELLIKSGMNIQEINIIRKHISQIKGGRLLSHFKNHGLVLILSDVLGDDLSTIASGPTTYDNSTYSMSLDLLKKYKILDKIPKTVLQVLKDGVDGKIEETVKSDNKLLLKSTNYLVGTNKIVCESIIKKAKHMGFDVSFLTDQLEGDAREVGRVIGKKLLSHSKGLTKPFVLISGGETTINVKGSGIGGRNQELAASVMTIIKESSAPIIFTSFGTDGIDGNSQFAGAIIDNTSLENRSIYEKLPIYLENNNLTEFFKLLGNSLIETGPTGTNVMDIQIGLILLSN